MPPRGKKGNDKKSKSKTTEEEAPVKTANPWSAEGVLTSMESSNDVRIESYSLHAYGNQIIINSEFQLNKGARYGLLGRNGSGKSTFLRSLASRDVPIPDHIDIHLLENEAPATDYTPIEYVIREAMLEVERIEAKIAEIMETKGDDSDELDALYERLERMDSTRFEEQASKILIGLGFDQKMLAKATKDMSGGWRMRVNLARALFVKPALMLLDEPTNHLDLEACVWLSQYLAKWQSCLIVTSHSQDFLNDVCSHMIHITPKKTIVCYTGNYDQMLTTKEELEVNQMKLYKKQQDDIQHLKKFIASAGTYANLVKQANSKQKILDKMEADGLIEAVEKEAGFSFKFLECEKLPPPVVSIANVSFSYSGKPEDFLYNDISLSFHADSRIALVGPNGAGKSTLLKLINRQLDPVEGEIKRHTHARFGFYNQHITDVLDVNLTPLEFIMKCFAGDSSDVTPWRSALGRFGVTGPLQSTPIGKMSDGQRRRLMFAYLAYTKPNMLLLDEPTNHLDMETIDALAGAIKSFDGGMLLVSHDFRLIDQVADEIWLCDERTVRKFDGSIQDYKKHLADNMRAKGLLDD